MEVPFGTASGTLFTHQMAQSTAVYSYNSQRGELSCLPRSDEPCIRKSKESDAMLSLERN